MGNLTRDPELRFTHGGVAVSDFTVAADRSWKTKDGELKEETSFIQCTLWGRHAENVCKYLEKGDPIYIDGRLSVDHWEGPEGDKRQKMKVVGENFQFV
jgi:single-strand DNA-binding protein